MLRELKNKVDWMQAQIDKCKQKVGKPKKEPTEIIDIKI